MSYFSHPFGGMVPHYFWWWIGASVFAYAKKAWTDYRQKRLARRAEEWPEQDATVVWAQSVTGTKSRHEAAPLFEGLLTYSYQGDELEVGEYRVTFSMEAEADEWARNLRNTRIRIRVNPANKKESVWIADQVERSRAHAEQSVMTDIGAAQPLAGALELWRLAVVVASTVAGPIAVWLHVRIVYGIATGNISALDKMESLSWGLYGVLIVCGTACATLVKRRFPLTGDATGYGHLSPEARKAMKIAGAYSTLCFIAILVWSGMHAGAIGDPLFVEFTSSWPTGFLGVWLIARRLGAEEDLGAQLASRTAKL